MTEERTQKIDEKADISAESKGKSSRDHDSLTGKQISSKMNFEYFYVASTIDRYEGNAGIARWSCKRSARKQRERVID